jgi:peroxiredoxin
MTTPVFHTLEEAFFYCRDMDASLRDRLETFSAAARILRPAMQEAVDRLVVRLMASDVGNAVPQIGDQMPPFILPDEKGDLVCLASLLRVGPVAVTFHRGHWCPYCRINTKALAEAQTRIAAEGAQIVAIMPDRQQFASALKRESNMHYPVLTDLDNGYALSLNLAIWAGRRIAGADVGVRPGPSTLPRQRRLDPAASGEFRRRCGRLYTRAIYRSGLPEAHGDRGPASGDPQCPHLAANPALVAPLYPCSALSGIENPGVKRNNSGSLRIGGRAAARTMGACR